MNTFDKIICVGKNYLAHAKELGDAVPEKPIIFLKPPSVLKEVKVWNENLALTLPLIDDNIQYECEVVLKLKKGGYQLSLEEAKQSIGWVSLGLDMTLRNLQTTLKKNGHPWTTSKVFIDSAVAGPWIEIHQFPEYRETPFSLSIQETIRQQALPSEMIVNPVELIVYISQFFPLCENDLIFTGTPAGVGSVQSGTIALLKWGKYHYTVNWK
jgi:2-keto-4-pentenoate hydratase/2-oxohepta-3-ene-1,7-dioic acid hydratase in catechol pathway